MTKAATKRPRSSSSQAGKGAGTKRLAFSVDAALFRELGERLVGKPHIALAELIKNSYDADATEVVVRFSDDSIEVSDNGNGMTPEEFRNFWMRVGSPHKQTERLSSRFGRSMTGSKGVGRLAVQFLGNELELRTRSRKRGAVEIRASVDWSEAVRAGELTSATARYSTSKVSVEYPARSEHGTAIVIRGLHHHWAEDELVGLAREVWWLQPPFHSTTAAKSRGNGALAFKVTLEHDAEHAEREFDAQMRAALDLWQAKITGKLTRPAVRGDRVGHAEVRVQFEDGDFVEHTFEVDDCAIFESDFEVRIYSLANRQSKGVRVDTAREYFKQFGGVHVYDAGFHLPYYGPDTDWLRIEIDHSHRLSRSNLLPAELQVANGLNNLPTQSRIFGVVNVDTAAEQAAGQEARRRDYLKIQVSRDRLVDNRGYEQLRDTVRWALDFYAMETTRRRLRAAERQQPSEPATTKLSRIERVLQDNRDRMPKRVYETLRAGVSDVAEARAGENRISERRMGLLGALATAGMASVAYEHEIGDQFHDLDELSKRLGALLDGANRLDREELRTVAGDLKGWVRRARGTRELFSHLASEESREVESRYRARTFIADIRDQMGLLLRGVDVNVEGIPPSLKLPLGTYAEWSAVFQNVLMNAVAATRETKRKEVIVTSRTRGTIQELLIQDTGVGVDLRDSVRLFDPFERKLEGVKRNGRTAAATGLGLTIVRMIAESRDVLVSFVEPDEQFSTAFQIAWSER
jgi:signal transduction histidine kinase